MITPLFSVVVPTYRRPQRLPRAIESVRAQTCGDFELIVVDDAPSEETAQIVARFEDERITYLRHETNRGNAAARNTGIRHARGTYVAFLDDDDEYLPHLLEKTREAFEAAPEEVGVVWGGVRWVRENEKGEARTHDELWQPQFESREQAYLSFLRERKIGTGCGVTVRRSCFDVVGLFDEAIRAPVDTDFLIRLIRHYDFRVVPSTLIRVYRQVDEGVHTDRAALAEGYERIMEKNSAALAQHDALSSHLHYKTGWLHYHAGQRARGRAHVLQAIRKQPLHGKAWAVLVLFEALRPERAARLHRQVSARLSRLRAFIR